MNPSVISVFLIKFYLNLFCAPPVWFSKICKKWVAIRIFGKANHDPYLRMIYLKQLVSTYTGCPTDWYPLLISIPDFSDGPIKKLSKQF